MHFVHYKVKNYDVFEIPPQRMLEFCENLHRSIPSFAPEFQAWIDLRDYQWCIHMDTVRRLNIMDANAAIEFKFTFF